MFNLIVHSDEYFWDTDRVEFPRYRVFEHTEDLIANQMSRLTPNDIDNIKLLPTLFAVEGEVRPTKFGYVTEIVRGQKNVQISFKQFNSLSELSVNALKKFGDYLEIHEYEINRTHWAIKNVDLFKVLKNTGVISSSQFHDLNMELKGLLPEVLTDEQIKIHDLSSLIAHKMPEGLIGNSPRRQLDLLSRSVKEWNEYRIKFPDFKPNLSNFSLRGMNIDGADLSHANLDSSDLNGVNLQTVKLSQANLDNSKLKDSNILTSWTGVNKFIACDLRWVSNLTQDQLNSMLGDSLTEIPNNLQIPEHWPNSEPLKLPIYDDVVKELISPKDQLKLLKEDIETWNQFRRINRKFTADFKGADLSYMDLTNANLQRSDLHGVNFKGSNLLKTDITHSSVYNTDFSGVDLTEAYTHGTTLSTSIVKTIIVANQIKPANLKYIEKMEQFQLDSMDGDSETIIPDNFIRPTHWPTFNFETDVDEVNTNSAGTALSSADNRSEIIDEYSIADQLAQEAISGTIIRNRKISIADKPFNTPPLIDDPEQLNETISAVASVCDVISNTLKSVSSNVSIATNINIASLKGAVQTSPPSWRPIDYTVENLKIVIIEEEAEAFPPFVRSQIKTLIENVERDLRPLIQPKQNIRAEKKQSDLNVEKANNSNLSKILTDSNSILNNEDLTKTFDQLAIDEFGREIELIEDAIQQNNFTTEQAHQKEQKTKRGLRDLIAYLKSVNETIRIGIANNKLKDKATSAGFAVLFKKLLEKAVELIS